MEHWRKVMRLLVTVVWVSVATSTFANEMSVTTSREGYQVLYYAVDLFRITPSSGESSEFTITSDSLEFKNDDHGAVVTPAGLSEFSIDGSRLVLEGKGYRWEGQPIEENDSIHRAGKRGHIRAQDIASGSLFPGRTSLQFFVPKEAGKKGEYRLISGSARESLNLTVNSVSMNGAATSFRGDRSSMDRYRLDPDVEIPMNIDVVTRIRHVDERRNLLGTELPVGKPSWKLSANHHIVEGVLGHWSAWVASASNQHYLILLKPDFPYNDVVSGEEAPDYDQYELKTRIDLIDGELLPVNQFSLVENVSGFEGFEVFRPARVRAETAHFGERFGIDFTGRGMHVFSSTLKGELMSRNGDSEGRDPWRPTSKMTIRTPEYPNLYRTEALALSKKMQKKIWDNPLSFLAPHDEQFDEEEIQEIYDRFGLGVVSYAHMTGPGAIAYRVSPGSVTPRKKWIPKNEGTMHMVRGTEGEESDTVEMEILIQISRIDPDTPDDLIGIEAAELAAEYYFIAGNIVARYGEEIVLRKTVDTNRHMFISLTATKILASTKPVS